MIAPHRVEEVKRLLTGGQLSQRKIARLTGISRATVGAIALGRRPDYPQRDTGDDDLFSRPSGPPARCTGCGGMVYLPCRLCHVRGLKRQEKERRRRRRSLERMLSGFSP